MNTDRRAPAFWLLAAFFAAYVLFLYGPMLVIVVLSFQGPEGGLTFPMRGVSLHWFHKLSEGLGVVDIGAALMRSLGLGLVVMAFTIVFSVLAGLAFRKRLRFANVLFFTVVASLIMPSIIVSLGIGLEFRLLDTGIKKALEFAGMESTLENYGTALGIYTSALGAHLTWTLPFGLLIMFAIFNRFNPAYEEAARDLGATPWQTFQAIGDVNTLPLELQGLTTTVTTPSIYALGTVTMVVSFLVMGLAVGLSTLLAKRQQAKRNT
jgi:putative spermidine/putrescine transport system permease protein